MGSGLTDDEFDNGSRHVKREHPGITFHELETKVEKHQKNTSSLISAKITEGLSTFLKDKDFTGVILVADRFETLPATMVSAYMGFTTIHLQGGEVTGNIDERIRHACTKLADYHFVSTKMSREYVLEMGEDTNTVFRVGCPSLDYIKEAGIKRYTPKEKYFICMFHPNTQSIETQYKETETLLKVVVDFCMRYGFVCHWYWPNPDPGREEILKLLDTVKEKYGLFVKKYVNQEPFQFLRKLSGAKFIVGNSSCGIREASYLGVPCVNVGFRQNLRERSWNVLDCSMDYKDIYAAMFAQKNARRYATSYLYGDTKAATRIVRILKDLEYVKKGPLNYPLRPKYMEDHIGEKRFRSHKIGITTGPKKKKQLESAAS